MRRLTAQDAAFLYLETPKTPMHVGSVTLFGPTDVSADVIHERFRVYTAARIDLLPSYWRQLQTTYGVTQPFWVHAPTVDLDYHMRRHTLPAPGTMEQLRTMVAELHATPLDRSHPLWEYHLIEGLEDGGFAVQMKVHHAVMDGVIGTVALSTILETTPTPAPGRPHSPWEEHERPGVWAAANSLMNAFWQQGVELARLGPKLATAVAGFGQNRSAVRELLRTLRIPPRTPLNVPISGNRGVGLSSISLGDAKWVAKAQRVTVNDVVMAVCAGALRRYLSERKALPKQPLVAGMPMTLRRDPSDRDYSNRTAAILCTLATDVADPIERLRVIAAGLHTMQDQFRRFRDIFPVDLVWPGVPLLMNGLFQSFARAGASGVLPPFMNLVISNVPGPRKTMYCAGVPAVRHFPLSIPYHNMALNITVVSYVDELNFGLTVCSDAVPDVQHVAELIVEEFEVLKHAVAALQATDVDMIDIGEEPARVPELAAPAPVSDAPPVRPRRRRAAGERVIEAEA
ncbi:MAG TPA: wax ester/triacylglycerol synthase family O-acyltransferase [Acidisphaera sp.]|nr:wax ester/triacylglycerol synthase family O-acyltransferase [Acidisphaera sp.]